jgi:dUTP pyrophosphatase
VQNISNEIVNVERGERIAQGMFVKVEQAEWVEEKELASVSRGGFGSTD